MTVFGVSAGAGPPYVAFSCFPSRPSSQRSVFVLMTAKSFNKRDVRYSNSKQKTVRRLLGERVLRVDSR